MIEYESLKDSNKVFNRELELKFKEILDKGWFILGSEVEEFEKSFSALHYNQPFLGVGSGTDAILLSLLALNLPKGSNVLISAYSYIATVLPILRCDLNPIFIEPELDTYNIDPSKIEEKITPNTSALILTHMFGRPCDMDPILEIVKEHNLALIEDCSQAHLSTYKKKIVGTFGDFGCFSFYPTKNLGALGDAGGILIKNEEDYKSILSLRNNGSSEKYHHSHIGISSRLDELQAGFLNIKLQYLNEITKHKQKLAMLYQELLDKRFNPKGTNESINHSFHIFAIETERRDLVKQFLLDNGIKTEIHYPIPPHLQPALSSLNYKVGDFPIAERLHNSTLSLPISLSTTEEDVKKVCKFLNQF